MNPNSTKLQTIQYFINTKNWSELELLLKEASFLKSNPWFFYAQALIAQHKNDYVTATEILQTSLKYNPTFIQSLLLLVHILSLQGQYSQTIPLLYKALKQRPYLLSAWQTLIQNLQNIGDIESVQNLIINLLDPNWLSEVGGKHVLESERKAYHNWRPSLGALSIINAVAHPHITEQTIDEMKQLWHTHFLPQQISFIHARKIDPDRPLKIVYFSNEWSAAPIQLGYHTLFKYHSTDYELHALIDNPDGQIVDLEQLNCFRSIYTSSSFSVLEIYQWLQEEQFDILVSLSGFFHARGLQLLGLKPCPITAYTGSNPPFRLGIPNLTLTFSDAVIQPQKPDQKSHYLPSFFRWHPPEKLQHLSAKKERTRTAGFQLGVIVSPNKLNTVCFELWAKLLKQWPKATLHFFNQTYHDIGLQKRIKDQMLSHGIAAQQIEFHAPAHHQAWYLGLKQFDLILDSFPYGGALSTCDALWMNVPVLSLKGGRKIAESIFTAIQHPEFLAESPQVYAQSAQKIIDQADHYIMGKHTLRNALLESPICNYFEHCQLMEATYRQAWKKWCQTEFLVS